LSFENFYQVITAVRELPSCRLCVAAAAEETVLEAVRDSLREGIVDFVLIGPEENIWRQAMKVSLNLQGIEIIDIADPVEAAHRAVKEVAEGRADILMKGMVNSSDFLRAVINPAGGMRRDRILSHMAVYEVPGYYRLIYMTDGGLNVSPNLEQKKAILQNGIEFLQAVGMESPKVAVLSANEKVDPKIPATMDARALKEMAEEAFPGAVIDGPTPLDIAVSYESALHKGIDSPVAGKADLLLVPNIEAGNILGKSIIYFAGGRMAGLVLGASRPVILTSRNEPPMGKMASIALAAYSIARNRKD
jgi:phosphate butyryltransferase